MHVVVSSCWMLFWAVRIFAINHAGRSVGVAPIVTEKSGAVVVQGVLLVRLDPNQVVSKVRHFPMCLEFGCMNISEEMASN